MSVSQNHSCSLDSHQLSRLATAKVIRTNKVANSLSKYGCRKWTNLWTKMVDKMLRDTHWLCPSPQALEREKYNRWKKIKGNLWSKLCHIWCRMESTAFQMSLTVGSFADHAMFSVCAAAHFHPLSASEAHGCAGVRDLHVLLIFKVTVAHFATVKPTEVIRYTRTGIRTEPHLIHLQHYWILLPSTNGD